MISIAATLVVVTFAYAKQCGDVDGDGTVTVSDAVNHLRAAAELPSACTLDVCDLNLDNEITVSDGTLALRAAAELEHATCTLEIGAEVAARTHGIMEVGVAVVGDVSAVRSAATVPCPDGGSFDETPTTLTYVDCREGDVVSTGTVDVVDVAGSADVQVTFHDFMAVRLSTGEKLTSSGTVTFSPRGTDLAVNGTIARSSNLRGEFTDAYAEVVADTSGDVVLLESGTVLTTVSRGIGPSLHVTTIETSIVGPQLTIAVVTFAGGEQQVVIAPGNLDLCDPCTSNAQCDAPLACLPCNSDCAPGAPHRCTVNFQNFAARCSDGLF